MQSKDISFERRFGFDLERARLIWILNSSHSAKAEIERIEASLDLADKDPSLPIHPHSRGHAYLLCGFFHDAQGDHDRAKELWARGYRRQAKSLGDFLQVAMDVLIMAALAECPDDPAVAEAVDSIVIFKSEPIQLAAAAFGRPDLGRLMTRSWASTRGRQLALDIALDRYTKADTFRETLTLEAGQAIIENAFAGHVDPDQEEIVFNTGRSLHAAFLTKGEISGAQTAQLVATYKGVTGLFGWGGVKGSLQPELRGPLAYIFAERCRHLGKPKEATEFLVDALKDAPQGTVLRRLVERASATAAE